MTDELPSIDEYLARIGLEQSKAPTAEFLDELIDALIVANQAEKLKAVDGG